jgi:conjugal transfer pilin signal peptidase TrbI
MMPPRNKIIRSSAAIVLFVSLGCAIPHYLTYSPTPSLGKRFFVMWPSHPENVNRGDYVRYPHKDVVTENKEVFMLKRVGCQSGQSLKVTPDRGYLCDNRWLGRAKEKSIKGEPATNFVWDGVVPTGYFFATGDHKDSYDSRYYGFVPVNIVVAKAAPLF